VIVTTIMTQAQAAGARAAGRVGAPDGDQMTAAVRFLAGYSPPALDTVLDSTNPGDDGGLGDYGPDPGDDGGLGDYGPEPYCTRCGAAAGIFAAHGGHWQHYLWGYAPGTKPEVYDAGHAPVIGWRPARSPESAVAF
jgi:hypothetical protein